MSAKLSIVEATWVVHQVFRRLGFDSDNLYVIPDANDGEVFVHVKRAEKEFDFRVGRRRMPVEDFMRQWSQFVNEANVDRISSDRLDRIYETYMKHLDAAGLVQALLKKGFAVGERN